MGTTKSILHVVRLCAFQHYYSNNALLGVSICSVKTTFLNANLRALQGSRIFDYTNNDFNTTCKVEIEQRKRACCQVISIKSRHITFLKGHVVRPYILYEIAN